MYTRAEIAALKTEFWNAFARYASAQPTLRGRKKLWVLHHTKVKGVALKFIVERRHVGVVIELSHNAHHERAEMLERISPYMEILQQEIDLPLELHTNATTEVGKQVTRIGVYKNGTFDYHTPAQWGEYFSFMAKYMYLLERNFLEIKPYISFEV
ncbi:MAG: DUF4268 domain-containing protein [Porphyromonas sp.]|nr:DUF4268 domain-containing protein [Porphyromonas sp.]